MNENIEAYLKQHYCRDYYNSYGETVEDEHYFMYREEVEDLIKLIVKECALTVQDFVDHRFPASEYPDRLKKYFGVEE